MDQQILEQIWQWKQEGWTLARIGEKVGLTRERIRQVLTKEEQRRGTKYIRIKVRKVDLLCAICQKSFKRLRSQVKEKNYCSRQCQGMGHGTPMTPRERFKYRYKRDPILRKKIRMTNEDWRKHRMKKESEEKRRKYIASWNKKNRQRILTTIRERYATDPEFRERKRRYCKEYRHRLYLKKLLTLSEPLVE